MLQKKGRSLPPGSEGDGPPRRYAEIVSLALKTELDDSRRTIKTVQRWTRASERTVKNWIAGTCGPDGDHLIAMLIHSDTMLHMLLLASRRFDIVEMLMNRSGSSADEHSGKRPEDRSPRRKTSLHHYPGPDPIDDPELDPDEAFVPNERQRWFLAELASGRRVSARELLSRFGISEKTAKRDIAGLKANASISFTGSRRKGRYRLR
ncbi:hypothetical protein MWN34_16770 [Ancylobacter sp. 6x-1]|uniref:HTH deoR-type domain-containing protein n=1 Tax=Ancylobacter crimeensis TaxID=2579147 RepID=A0ABT0DFQ2_9HYPH|nr:HTH domain-containing protein [Ancylobacter crimeensis]MCK0198557.1 hypothetical protein [Ancylobacter crimeensis]